jgi:hypothetical protein
MASEETISFVIGISSFVHATWLPTTHANSGKRKSISVIKLR